MNIASRIMIIGPMALVLVYAVVVVAWWCFSEKSIEAGEEVKMIKYPNAIQFTYSIWAPGFYLVSYSAGWYLGHGLSDRDGRVHVYYRRASVVPRVVPKP